MMKISTMEEVKKTKMKKHLVKTLLNYHGELVYTCKNCTASYYDISTFRYCPHCGALIEEVEEG